MGGLFYPIRKCTISLQNFNFFKKVWIFLYSIILIIILPICWMHSRTKSPEKIKLPKNTKVGNTEYPVLFFLSKGNGIYVVGRDVNVKCRPILDFDKKRLCLKNLKMFFFTFISIESKLTSDHVLNCIFWTVYICYRKAKA